MHDINIVIPIKDPARAKERLARVLRPEQRVELAFLLFERVLRFFADLPGAGHVLVVTDSTAVAAKAQDLGASVLMERQARGETEAVEYATAWSLEHGYASQLVVPGDMVALDRRELSQLLALPRPEPSVILCPATGEDGTNAILSTPPNAIPFRFGARSFPDYCRRAEERGVRCRILRLSSLVLDLDTPDDLQALVRTHPDHPVTELLGQWSVPVKSF